MFNDECRINAGSGAPLVRSVFIIGTHVFGFSSLFTLTPSLFNNRPPSGDTLAARVTARGSRHARMPPLHRRAT